MSGSHCTATWNGHTMVQNPKYVCDALHLRIRCSYANNYLSKQS